MNEEEKYEIIKETFNKMLYITVIPRPLVPRISSTSSRKSEEAYFETFETFDVDEPEEAFILYVVRNGRLI